MSGRTIQPPAVDYRERDIFLEALEQPTSEQRLEYLDKACGDDQSLRAAVEALLQSHREDAFLETPAPGVPLLAEWPGRPSLALVTEKPGDRIGNYKLLQQIGEGGCGTVYMAEQDQPVRRRVALKVI